MDTGNVDTSTVASVVSSVISALGLQTTGGNSNDGIRASRDGSSARAQHNTTRGTIDNRNPRYYYVFKIQCLLCF